MAARGDMPETIRAGRVMKEPPPARAFCSPAHRPAKKMRTSIDMGIPGSRITARRRVFYTFPARCRQG